MDLSIIIIVTVVIALPLGFIGGFFWRTVADKKYQASHEEQIRKDADRIIKEAKNEAELKKKTAILEAKDEWFKAKSEFEKEANRTRESIRQEQQRLKEGDLDLKRREELLGKRETEFTARENFLNSKEKTLRTKDNELSRLIALQNDKLEKISHMTQEDAKKLLLENLEGQVRYECAQMIKEIKDQAKSEAEREAKEIIIHSIQRCAADTTVESTVSVVHLPSDEMKGRIIGREGRNIRSFEEATGIDVIVDDTPEAVILSGFDPIKREIARLALEKLITDGRIHPGRIEELIKKSERELEKMMKEEAEEVIFELDVHGLKPKMVDLLGRLRYRTSYGQNVLQHSKEVAILAGLMASELGLDSKTAIRAGLLHDIGKSIDRETEGTHSELGAELANKNGENEIIANAIAAHHEDVPPISMYPILIQAADTISSTRPGVRRETLSNYINRLTKLEEIADSFRGVQKAFVIQAGREIRVMVEPEQIDDAQAEELAGQVSQKIQEEMEYPGQIKVTIIRESRYTEYAK
ncbi:ribonuclease Y [Chitinispirillales bacterium ANBcel5]|uniref:ribonuclease Y n=1 Tax=Cellulosispirillum alkaliphilum TaxID=3039283 RepID=UPI002A52B34D|nr:ribonuclease Y [Chitinispirillales bacterium ANBcel5]